MEILVLRQQLAVFKRARPRPQLRPIDRAFWSVVSRVWSRWADALAIVKPETVLTWHRRGFARFWAWKSRRIGRPPLAPEIVALIVQMTRENPLWSRRRIAGELAKLGHEVGKDAVAR
jgi:putative transposase